MKYLLFLLISYSAVAQKTNYYDEQERKMIAILDSIDRFPYLYHVMLTYDDSTLQGHLKERAHIFEGFWRYGKDSTGRNVIKLYNRQYARKYKYIINDKEQPDDFDISNIDSSVVKSITIFSDRAGQFISHCTLNSEYLIIIRTK